MNAVTLKRVVAGTAIAGALGLSVIGVGAGMANADPPSPWPPGQPGHHDGPPGDFRGPSGPPGDFHRVEGRPPWRGAPWGDGPAPWGWGAPPRPDWRGPLPPPGGPPPPPFDYWGYTVQPVWDPGFSAWGFWLFGVWIPL